MEETASHDLRSTWEIYKYPFILASVGLLSMLIGVRLLFLKEAPEKVQFIEESTASAILTKTVKVDIAGAVERPGVYTVSGDGRIQDVLVLAGGLALDADRNWIERYLNLAAKAIDGSKIYIPHVDELKNTESRVLAATDFNASKDILNINNASKTELEDLPGIGEVTAQKIIDNRPYQTIEELISKKVIGKAVFEKIKDQISTY